MDLECNTIILKNLFYNLICSNAYVIKYKMQPRWQMEQTLTIFYSTLNPEQLKIGLKITK